MLALAGDEVVYPSSDLRRTAKISIQTENGATKHRIAGKKSRGTPLQPQGRKLGELGRDLVRHQHAIGLASYDVVRSHDLDRFEAESAACRKAAPDPLGLCT